MSIPMLAAGVNRLSQASFGQELDQALTDYGFVILQDLGLPRSLVNKTFASSAAFFDQTEEFKTQFGYRSAAENFGYQGIAQENLDPAAPPDLKETFTLRNLTQYLADEDRWPSLVFRDTLAEFYQAVMLAVTQIQRQLALVLGQPEDFFTQYHSGENITVRLLYYPALNSQQVLPGQLGAGAHTDYGLMTLLFQDQQAGLQVMDKTQQWLDVPPMAAAAVMNSGDLLEHWTNGRYPSTLHRVVPRVGGQARFSIAVFVDPDSDTQVEVLPSCTSAQHPAKYAAITVGEHLQSKIAASHKDRFS